MSRQTSCALRRPHGLRDYGQPDEARTLARELAAIRIPIIAVLGNHDWESERQDEVRQILIGSLLRRTFPDRPPFRVLEVPAG